MSGVCCYTQCCSCYFSETAELNHFILIMNISLVGLFNIYENMGKGLHTPAKNYGEFCVIHLNVT